MHDENRRSHPFPVENIPRFVTTRQRFGLMLSLTISGIVLGKEYP